MTLRRDAFPASPVNARLSWALRLALLLQCSPVSSDEEVPNAVEQLVQILTTDLPEDKEIIMTFAQQLKQQGLEQGLKKGLEEGEHRKAIAIAAIAKKLLDEGRSPGAVQKLTGLSEKDIMVLVDTH
jgi:predicted transposase/invertase (TIGR01784 family)